MIVSCAMIAAAVIQISGMFSASGPGNCFDDVRVSRVLNSLDCKLRAAECEKLAEGVPNPRVQATLRDIARTWTRLALEAEQTLKQSRPPLQLIVPQSSSSSR
jgi:hypothetical protein